MASSQAWADSVELIVSDNSPELTSDTCSAVLSAWPGKWAVPRQPAEYRDGPEPESVHRPRERSIRAYPA